MSQSPRAILDQFEEVRLQAPLDTLSKDVRAALPHIERAMRRLDWLFMRQLGPQVVALGRTLDEHAGTPDGNAFWLFKGPYNKLDGGKPFIDGVDPIPVGRAVYPADLDPPAFERYLDAHPDQRDRLLDPYAVVVRDGETLDAVPYTEVYADDLAYAADALRTAADLIEHEGLAGFLRGRADALVGRRAMRESDADWVKLVDTPLEVVIGPYEVYEDHLRGVKAFYEGMLLIVDREACGKLSAIEAALGELAKSIPCPAGSRSAVGGMAPLIVADELLATGEGHAGILASAFNLPNDPWVRGEVGWKQIMIRNVMNAKFDACTRRIAKRVLTPEQLVKASFDAYFHFVLLHEVTHGLGPAYRADGSACAEACGRHFTALEEAKADTGSLCLLLSHQGQFGIPAFDHATIGISYLAGLYRSARFGLHEAHGRANVIQYAFLKAEGALCVADDGQVTVDVEKLPAAAEKLLLALTTLQAQGSQSDIEMFLARFAEPPAELVARIGSLADLPVDILPRWPKL